MLTEPVRAAREQQAIRDDRDVAGCASSEVMRSLPSNAKEETRS
jgi:hypothetical protein